MGEEGGQKSRNMSSSKRTAIRISNAFKRASGLKI